MLAALEAGKVDAVLFDLPLAVAVADHSDGRLEAVAQLPGAEQIAAALPQGLATTSKRSTRRCAR